MKWRNLVLVGTSHIAKESVQNVKNALLEEKPAVVALELDRNRFMALMSKQKDEGLDIRMVRRIGLAGFLFAYLGRMAQKHLGGKTGIKPGSEFLTAARIARSLKLPIAFIDRDIEITLRRFSSSITAREVLRLLADLVTSPFRKNDLAVEVVNLNEIPDEELVRKVVGQVKTRYPGIYRALIEERDEFMAQKLVEIMRSTEGTVVAVVGAGHQEGLLERIKAKYGEASYSFHTTAFAG